MARTIDAIKQSIIDAKNADSTLAALSSTSAVAIWRLWIYVQAVCIWTLEKLYDLHIIEAKDLLAAQKPHTLRWYEEMAKKYQHGYALVEDEDYYDNSSLTETQTNDSLIVKHAKAVEVPKGVRVKVAGETAGDLAPLSGPELTAFQSYMGRIKDAGVKLYFTNNVADSLQLEMDIYYDPLILDASGQRLDGTSNTPVQDAIAEFLKNGISFNGQFILADLVEALREVEGVEIPHIVVAKAKYGLLPYSAITVKYQPDAGYLRIANPSDLTLNFIAYEPV